MELCAKKYIFGDKSTFGKSQNGQNMPKKGQQEKVFFCTLNKCQLPTHITYVKKFYILHSLYKSAHF